MLTDPKIRKYYAKLQTQDYQLKTLAGFMHQAPWPNFSPDSLRLD